MSDIGLRIEGDVKRLEQLLGVAPLGVDEIATVLGWSKERTAIYIENLLRRGIVERCADGRYSMVCKDGT